MEFHVTQSTKWNSIADKIFVILKKGAEKTKKPERQILLHVNFFSQFSMMQNGNPANLHETDLIPKSARARAREREGFEL